MTSRNTPTRLSPKKAPSLKKSEDKVIKRPKRGYHKFRNGLLNAAPKGSEKDLVRINRDSPLLRLPPEIRNRIWEYALGGQIFEEPLHGRYYARSNMKLLESDTNYLSLLSICRQIYTETALIPFKVSTFSFKSTSNIVYYMSELISIQRNQISLIQLETEDAEPMELKNQDLCLSKHFPGLKYIHVLVSMRGKPEEVLDRSEKKLGERLQAENNGVQITFERRMFAGFKRLK